MISSVPKKAVHVKWAGKTIALGTFPIAEADEKCARAKALTRAWRSTIRPKPSREWVISELERLNVRVVTGRSPRDDEYENNNAGRLPTAASVVGMNDNNSHILGGYHYPSLGNIVDPNFVGRRGSVTASLLNPTDVARVNGGGGGGGPSAWPRGQGQAMNGFGFDPSSVMPHQTRTSSLSGSSIVSSSANEITAKDGGGTSTATGAPPHRPLVGGGSAAAYEAARAEHYRQLASNQDTQGGDSAREQAATSFNGSIPTSTSSAIYPSEGILPPHSMESVSNIGAPSTTMNGSQGRIGGLSLLASQHYEMLKLHHLNLLNEIQETTLMMNIYQQQLQQQQQLEMQQQQQQAQEQHQQEQQPPPQEPRQQQQQLPQEQQPPQEQQLHHQQLQQHQQQYDRDDQDSHHIPHNQGVVSPTQQVMNNFGENQYTNELPRSLPQSKQDDGTDMVGSEHSENTDIDKSDDTGNDNSTLDNDPTIAKHDVGNDKISREDKLARIKAEIEERKRMLEELSMAVDEQEEETFKKPKMSQV